MIFVAVYLEQLKNNESSQSYTNFLELGNRFKIFLPIIPGCYLFTLVFSLDSSYLNTQNAGRLLTS